jgi:hypothetical protein
MGCASVRTPPQAHGATRSHFTTTCQFKQPSWKLRDRAQAGQRGQARPRAHRYRARPGVPSIVQRNCVGDDGNQRNGPNTPAESSNAVIRAQQRGITPAQRDAVLRYADMEARRGDGCASIWISRRELQRLGPLTPEGVQPTGCRDSLCCKAPTVLASHSSEISSRRHTAAM